MKKALFLSILVILCCGICHAAEITSIRSSISAEKIRLVIDISEKTVFSPSAAPGKISIDFPGCTARQEVLDYRILDAMIDKISFSGSGTGLRMDIMTGYHVESSVFELQDPFRVVVDILRKPPEAASAETVATTAVITAETQVPAGPMITTENIAYGVSLFKINTDGEKGQIKGFSLLVDTGKADVTPVISVPYIKGRDGENIFGSIFGFLGAFDNKPQRYSHFAKKRVSAFAKAANAVAGINGSFFFGNGTPVGALIVNGQVISSPHLNRTALLIKKDGESEIDSLRMDGYLKMHNGETLSFSGVNQPLNHDGIMVYTPDYQTTDPSGVSTNIVVVNGSVESITYGETRIPGNGFVISANGTAGEAIKDRFNKGDTVKWFFMTTPSLDKVAHVIAGGPRLILDGQKYITAIEERFKNDVAKSRAARTAVGITNDGKLMFVVVESNGSRKGATLDELADLMLDLGAYNAMNLDGGGSSTMVVKGKTLNEGAGRAVSNAIVIKPRSFISNPSN